LETTFIRPCLGASAKADPAAEVNWLLDLASGALEGQDSDKPDQLAYNILVYWVAFKRIRPDLLVEASDVIRQLEHEMKNRGVKLVQAAFRVINPEAWLLAAKTFSRQLEEECVPAEQDVQTAAELWWGLDEGTLVQAAAELTGIKNRLLARRLQKCLNWTLLEPAVFGPAAVFIQAMAKSFRPEIEDQDGPIAATCLKYAFQLDGMEEIEKRMRFEGKAYSPVNPSAVREFVRQQRRKAVRG